MRASLAIFDMDGTILDTLEDLAGSLNYALEKNGFDRRTTEQVRGFIGDGIRKLVERGLPDGCEGAVYDTVLNDFIDHYKRHCADKTRPYEGIIPAIRSIREAGIRTAVVSNKADFAVKQLCDRFFDGLFDAAAGHSEAVRRKPAPDTVNMVLRRLGTDRSRAVYIGDSEVDGETAKNAGMPCISVSWGYRDSEFLAARGLSPIVHTPAELTALLLAEER